MPLELGFFLEIKCSSSSASRKKTCLIFVKDKKNVSFITDLNGMDVESHADNPEQVIPSIRNWLCNDAKIQGLHASIMRRHFKKFEEAFPAIIKEIGYEPDEPQYGDILKITAKWLEANPAQISVSASGEIATTIAGDVAKANRADDLTATKMKSRIGCFHGSWSAQDVIRVSVYSVTRTPRVSIKTKFEPRCSVSCSSGTSSGQCSIGSACA
jgi:hypothetical protein